MKILVKYINNEEQLKTKSKHLQKYNICDHKKDTIEIIQNLNKGKQLMGKPLIIPILLILNQRDHKFNIENATDIQKITDLEQRKQQILRNLDIYQTIQKFLLKQAHFGTIIPVNFHNIESTLDTIHDIVIDKIEVYEEQRNQWCIRH